MRTAVFSQMSIGELLAAVCSAADKIRYFVGMEWCSVCQKQFDNNRLRLILFLEAYFIKRITMLICISERAKNLKMTIHQ